MDKDIIGIRCKCDSNPDLNGYWSRKDLEQDCEDLEIPKKDWLSYLFDHLFIDYDGWNTKLEDAFIENDSLVSMRVMIGNDGVELTKWYK